MRFQAALIREQGVTFAVVAVQPHVLHNRSEAESLIHQLQTAVFPGIPVVLANREELYGRPDIVRYLRQYPPGALPWQWYTLN